MRKRAWMYAVAAVAALTLVGQVAIAGSHQANLGATRISVASGEGDYTKEKFSWEGISGAVTKINVPDGETGLIVVRFAAASRCDQGEVMTLCEVRILADEVPMSPNPIWFDTDDSGDNYAEAHATQVVGGPFGPGTHTVAVQFRTRRPTYFAVFDFVLTVELWRVS